MLERVYVDNYRCMVNFDCEFRRNQLILGDNGSGKTTLFDVLALLRDFSAHGLPVDSRWQGMTRTRWQENAIQTFELDVSEKKGLFQFHLSVDSSGFPKARPRVLKEEVQFSGKPLFRFAQGEVQLYNDRYEKKENYPFDEHRSALATITDRPENKKLSWFKRWLASLLFIAPDPHQMHPVATTEALAPTQNLNNFADWYRHIRQESDDDRGAQNGSL